MKYMISHQGQESGPFTLDQIVSKVRARELEIFDYIFDESKGDWVLLMEFGPLTTALKSNKPPAPTQTSGTQPKKTIRPMTASAPIQPEPTTKSATGTGTSPHAITEWFILKGEHRFGPFAFTDVIRMLQQKVVFPFDFVWHAGLNDWRRIAEVDDFKVENVRSMFEKNGKSKDVFVQRKFKRKKYDGKVILHDNLSLWKGEGFEISKGGVGITMKNALVVPGQQVHVHFSGSKDWPSFNAVCEVVSKKFVNDGSPVEYGLRFLSLSQEAQDQFMKKVA